MAEQQPADTSDEAQIRHQRQLWKAAFEAGDVARIMSFYAPGAETVAFDILPPLQFAGWPAYKADWGSFLELFDTGVSVETKDIAITCSGEVAFIHGLIHLTSTMGGKPFDIWMRATNGLRKIDGTWLVVHDHVSVPVDIRTGRSSMDLVP